MSNQDDKKLIINDVNKKLEENPNLSFVFKEGFLENLKTYHVFKTNFTNGDTKVLAGQLIYKEKYGFDDKYKYVDEEGDEKKLEGVNEGQLSHKPTEYKNEDGGLPPMDNPITNYYEYIY